MKKIFGISLMLGTLTLITLVTILGVLSCASIAFGAAGDPILEPVLITEIESTDRSGVDGTLISGTAGTSGNVAEWNADGDLVDAAIAKVNIALATGDTFTGVHDFGGATSLEIPNSATPTVDAIGEIALDTTITSHKGLLVYDHTGSEDMTVIAIPTADLVATDNYIIKYDLAGTKFTMEEDSGGSPGSFGAAAGVTIATGVIDLSAGANYASVAGEGAAADQLDEIQAAAVGDIVVLQRSQGVGYTITVADGTYLQLQADFLLDHDDDMIMLIAETVGANDTFKEISRANNG
jgi:hypothetical protein